MQKTQQRRRKLPNVTFRDLDEGRVPVYETEDAYVSFPEVDPKIPEGVVGATCVPNSGEVTLKGKGLVPLKSIKARIHEPLPYHPAMKELESVDEELDINLQTGEITSNTEYKVLDEFTHWYLRLYEYENRMKARGIDNRMIQRNLQGKIKQLKMTRDLDMTDKAHKIPVETKQALEYLGVHL